MTQEVQTVDMVGSYARRTGDEITLVIVLPDAEETPGSAVQLRLRGQSRFARVDATTRPRPDGPGVVVTASVPVARLRPDVYRIALRSSPEEPFHRLQVRLLTSRKQPIALLPGPIPRTVMAPPEPARRSARSGHAGSDSRTPVQTVARVVDLALGRLPADRARRYRSTLRTAARRTGLI